MKNKINKIAIICPSRDRVDSLSSTLKSWKDTNNGFSDFFPVCDSDQENLYHSFNNVIISPKTKKRGMNDPTNFAAIKLSKTYDYIFFMGDDHKFRTKGWDESFVKVYNNIKYGFIYGNDLFQGINLPTACCISSDIVEALGYISYPELNHLYVDNYWLTLGRLLKKIVYMNDIIVEHMHPSAGKANNDPSYTEVNNNKMYLIDRNIFESINFSNELDKLKFLKEQYNEI